jgi:hypothetical protein
MPKPEFIYICYIETTPDGAELEALVIKMQPPKQMLAALKAMGIETP